MTITTTKSVVKATTSVIIMEPRKTQVATTRVESNIFLNWAMNPMRNPVATRPITFPLVYMMAKAARLTRRINVESRERSTPIEKQMPLRFD
jgi:hypothetical protein